MMNLLINVKVMENSIDKMKYGFGIFTQYVTPAKYHH